jgi:hypothetical protein
LPALTSERACSSFLLLGLAALPELNKDTFPEINLYKVQVTMA